MRLLITVSALVLLCAGGARAQDPETPDAPIVAPTPDPDDAPAPTPSPLTETTTTTTTTTTSPATTTTMPAPAGTPFDACVAQARTGATRDAVVRCLETVIDADPDSPDAIRARAARSMLEAFTVSAGTAAAPSSSSDERDPGRLELIGVTGVFGVWNAIAGGIVVGSTFQTDPGPTFLGTAAAALALGVGFGYGGSVLGDIAQLDEGGGKLVASGLIWGSNVGIASAVWLLDIVKPQSGAQGTQLTLGSIVALGYVGGAAGLAAAKLGRFDAAQVSLVNSGGAMGSFLGGMVAFNLLANNVEGTGPYAFTYIAGNVAGLVGFGLLGNQLDLRWSETLIGDLGMVVGGTTAGLGMLGVLLTLGGEPDGKVLTGLMTGAASVGVVGGYAAGIAVALLLRPDVPVDPGQARLIPATAIAIDRTGQPVTTMGLGLQF